MKLDWRWQITGHNLLNCVPTALFLSVTGWFSEKLRKFCIQLFIFKKNEKLFCGLALCSGHLHRKFLLPSRYHGQPSVWLLVKRFDSYIRHIISLVVSCWLKDEPVLVNCQGRLAWMNDPPDTISSEDVKQDMCSWLLSSRHLTKPCVYILKNGHLILVNCLRGLPKNNVVSYKLTVLIWAQMFILGVHVKQHIKQMEITWHFM